jgi:hypothetical protein
MNKRLTMKCVSCGSDISLSNISKHTNSKRCISGGKQISNPSKVCKYCGEIFTTPMGRGVHEIQCVKNPESRILNLGRTAWNKGNKSKPDTRNPDLIGKHGGYRPNAGISKKFKVLDSFKNEVCLQSTYELRCSEILNELGIQWIRPKALKYDNKNYFADFYLTDFDLYLDPKNDYKAKLDEDKIKKVVEQNNVKVFVLLEKHLTQEYIASITQLVE